MNTLLFSLIRGAICGQNIDKDVLDECKKSDVLAQLYKVARKHDIAHLVAYVVNKYKLLESDELLKVCQKDLVVAVLRYERIKQELSRISEIFEKNEIAFIPLKGSVIRKYYPEPWMRTSCDIDVLIRVDDVEKAIVALCEAGFKQENTVTTHDYQLTSPTGIHLELHYTLKQDESILCADETLDNVWQNCVLEVGKRYQYCMTNEMFLFYHIAHMAKHFIRGGCGIRPLIDLWLLINKTDINEEYFNSLLGQTKLGVFYRSSVDLCRVLMEDLPHNYCTLRMEEYILTGGVYGTASNSAIMKSAKGESKLGSFMKIMFLPRVELQITYPKLKKYPILLPYYQIKRWFRIFKREKRENVKALTDIRNSVTTDETNNAKFLLEELGLK